MRLIAFAGVVALSLVSSGQTHTADPLARYDDHDTKGATRVAGPSYVNNNYGYSVDIPAGQVGWMNTPPSPNHGFAIYLGDRRSIEVDASFDSALLGSTAAVADAVAGYMPGAQNRKALGRLGGRAAMRVDQVFAKSDRRRVVVARWDDTGGPGDAINFTLTLETTKASYTQDERTFETLVDSFRFMPRLP